MELPGRCGDWLDTATVTAQGLSSRSTRRARGGGLHLAISGDFSLAPIGAFGRAADRRGVESVSQVLREQGLQVAPRSCRAWRTRPPSARALSDAEICDRLLAPRAAGPAGRPAPEILYGRRKMTAWLNRALASEGHAPVSKHTVHRLMAELGMKGLVRGRKTRTTVPGGKDARRAGDLLNRQFSAPRPNHAWVTDFTYVPTWSGFVYVALAIDLYSRAIVGWSASTIKDVAFVEDCLAMALWRRDQAGH